MYLSFRLLKITSFVHFFLSVQIDTNISKTGIAYLKIFVRLFLQIYEPNNTEFVKKFRRKNVQKQVIIVLLLHNIDYFILI